MYTSILFLYEDENLNEYYTVIDIEFSVHEDKIEIIDMEVSDVVGESDKLRTRIAKDVLSQFNPVDYAEHFMQAAFEWENPDVARLPAAFEYIEGQDYNDPYMDDDLNALRDGFHAEGWSDE